MKMTRYNISLDDQAVMEDVSKELMPDEDNDLNYQMDILVSHIADKEEEIIISEIRPFANKLGAEYHYTFNDEAITEALTEYIRKHQLQKNLDNDAPNELVSNIRCPHCGTFIPEIDVVGKYIDVADAHFCYSCGRLYETSDKHWDYRK